MRELFRLEAENQTQALVAGLLALENNPSDAALLEACMRAAHSLKGAARIVDLTPGVDLSHAMEDCLVAAQRGRILLGPKQIDLLLHGVDLLMAIARTPEAEQDLRAEAESKDVASFIAELADVLKEAGPQTAHTQTGNTQTAKTQTVETQIAKPVTMETQPVSAASAAVSSSITPSDDLDSSDRVLRVTAEHLNRLLGLAGESLMASRRLKPFVETLLKLKRLHGDSSRVLDGLGETLSHRTGDGAGDARAQAAVIEAQQLVLESQQILSQRLAELEMFDRHATSLAQRLYDEALACRMRPFADGVRRFPRMVRDLGHMLGKRVRLEISGAETQVDRDILEKLDAPLGHLLHNAIDHGIETPEERAAAGKPPEGTILLEARHSAGQLQIAIADDGRGIDLDQLREAVVERQLSNAETVEKLSENELLEFLFLPGFTMKDIVTEISGRGVGLDVVQNMIKQVRGIMSISSQLGKGTRFQLHLPLTLSVIRTILVEIGGEPYAFPLAHIVCILKLTREQVELIEGRQHFNFDGRQVGLVTAHQVLERGDPANDIDELSVVVVSNQQDTYGLIVDRFTGQQELVVQPFDPRLGKIKNVSAAALLEDGSPVLLLDVEDMIRSVEKLTSSGHIAKVRRSASGTKLKRQKRVLVVDDSLTVRELERKILDQHGYEVEVAVDGMDGWNVLRAGDFDLVVTDIDMPRMDGIELVTLIRKDVNLKSRPVMIVSYKDREEDRQRGLEAGADYYLTKSSFHDETLLQAVVDLIGEADA